MTVRFRTWALGGVVVVAACTSGVQHNNATDTLDFGAPGSFYPAPHGTNSPPNTYGTPPAEGNPCNFACSKAAAICGADTVAVAECEAGCSDGFRLCPAEVKALVVCLFAHPVVCQSHDHDGGTQDGQPTSDTYFNFPTSCYDQLLALVDCEEALGGAGGSSGSGGSGQGGNGGDIGSGGVGGDGGSAGATGGCTTNPDCTGCADACSACICTVGDPTQCTSACTGTGGTSGTGGSSGTGGTSGGCTYPDCGGCTDICSICTCGNMGDPTPCLSNGSCG